MYQADKDLSVVGVGARFHEFADAIRRGCVLRPKQCFENLFEGEDGACALGAARAVGYDEYQHDETADLVECPLVGCGEQGMLYDIIPHMNDGHRWTRERIADWMETL